MDRRRGFIEGFWEKKIHHWLEGSDILEGKAQVCFLRKLLKDLKGFKRIRTRIASVLVRVFSAVNNRTPE